MFVNKDFLDVINGFVDKNYRSHLKTIFNTIIGGECLIMRDAKDVNDEKPYRYIILYYDLNDIQGNEIDFFLFIENKKERQAADRYILQNNLWNYFKKIKYNYKDEYKKIYNDSYQEIGYVVRCSDIIRIETYIAKIESLKQQNTQSVPYNSNANFNSNSNNINANFNNMGVSANINSNNMKVNQNSRKPMNVVTSIAPKIYAKNINF